jgi:phosphoketolase
VRIVCVANPRRLYRSRDVAWQHSAEPDDRFMTDAAYDELFGGDALIAVSGGGTTALEPVLLRSRAAARELFGWQRGETTASPAEIMAFNGITADGLAQRALELVGDIGGAADAA